MTDSTLPALHRAWQKASRDYFEAARSQPENRLGLLRAERNAEARWIRASHDARDEFASARGWRLAGTPFTIEQLRTKRSMHVRMSDWSDREQQRPWFDHPEFFRDGHRPSRPAAIVVHSYASPRECVAHFRQLRLKAEILPLSWYYPGGATAFALTRAQE